MKHCLKCDTIKPLTDFGFKNRTSEKYQSYCKSCQRDYGIRYYHSNKEKYEQNRIKNKRLYHDRNTDFIVSYLKLHPCVDCGETDIEVLQFDHINLVGSKSPRIGAFINGSLRKLKEEIDKCEIRCGNCHIRRTRKQLDRFREK